LKEAKNTRIYIKANIKSPMQINVITIPGKRAKNTITIITSIRKFNTGTCTGDQIELIRLPITCAG